MQKDKKNIRIIYSGGGTLGSVTPLIAVSEELRKFCARGECELAEFWAGTRNGPEKKFVESYGMPFFSITSGKLRRTFNLKNLFIPFFIFLGFIESFFLIIRLKPRLIAASGGFVSVPLVWAAYFFGIPALIHQEDFEIGLANLLMAPFAASVTTAIPEVAKKFPHTRVRAIGNPVRSEIREAASINKSEAKKILGFKEDIPVLLVLGGGTGANAINSVVRRSSAALQKYFQILHITGLGKGAARDEEGYKAKEFLDKDQLPFAYRSADIVVSRAGMGTIGELGALELPVLLIPMPDSHQEKNAQYFEERAAARVLPQARLSPIEFVESLGKFWADEPGRKLLAENLHKLFPADAAEKMAELYIKISK